MKPILIRFKDKDYYVDYDMLLNKANDKLFAYEDEELTKNAKLNGQTLIFNKKDMEDKLKGDIKMSSRMPGAAKTENVDSLLGLGSSPEQLEKMKTGNKKKFDMEIDKIIRSDMGTLVKNIPADKIEYALNFLKRKADLGAFQFLNNMNIKKLERALEHKSKSKNFKEIKMTKEQKLRKYIRESIKKSIREDYTDYTGEKKKGNTKIIKLLQKLGIKFDMAMFEDELTAMIQDKFPIYYADGEYSVLNNRYTVAYQTDDIKDLAKWLLDNKNNLNTILRVIKEDAPYGQPDEDKYLFKTGQEYLAGIQGDSSMNEGKQVSIVGTAKLSNVSEGDVSLQYDKNIVKWFKQFNEENGDEIIYMNYENIAKQISKLTGAIFDDYMDNPYWDEHYINQMDFHTDEDISDEQIKKALRGKVFTIKLKAEQNTFNENTVETPSAEELAAKQKAAEEAKKKTAYQRFFSQALAKFGYSSPASIPDEKKKSFYDYIDANWTSKREEPKTEGFFSKDKESKGYVADFNDYAKNTFMSGPSVGDRYEGKESGEKYEISKIYFGTNTILLKGKDGEIEIPKDSLIRNYKKIEEITETSATGGVAGYETPAAFTGKKGISKKQKSIANQLGYELIDKSYAVKDQGDTQDLKEGLDSYYFKDENLTAEQKLGLAMRQVRNNISEVEKIVAKTIKMKNENGINSSEVGKRTYQALKRINEKTIRLMIALQELK